MYRCSAPQLYTLKQATEVYGVAPLKCLCEVILHRQHTKATVHGSVQQHVYKCTSVITSYVYFVTVNRSIQLPISLNCTV